MEFSEHDLTNKGNGEPSQDPVRKVSKSGKPQPSPAYSGPMTSPAGVFDYWRVFFNRQGNVPIPAGLGTAIGFFLPFSPTPNFQGRAKPRISSLKHKHLKTARGDTP